MNTKCCVWRTNYHIQSGVLLLDYMVLFCCFAADIWCGVYISKGYMSYMCLVIDLMIFSSFINIRYENHEKSVDKPSVFFLYPYFVFEKWIYWQCLIIRPQTRFFSPVNSLCSVYVIF